MCQAYDAEWSFVTWLERRRTARDLESQCPSHHDTYGRCVLQQEHDGQHRNPNRRYWSEASDD